MVGLGSRAGLPRSAGAAATEPASLMLWEQLKALPATQKEDAEAQAVKGTAMMARPRGEATCQQSGGDGSSKSPLGFATPVLPTWCGTKVLPVLLHPPLPRVLQMHEK